jgi:hypothetical protein
MQPIARRTLFLSAAIIVSTVGVYSQTVNPAKVKINGVVGLNSTYAQVVKLLGRPKKETKPQKEECTGGHEKTVEYDGVTFYLMDGPSRGHKTYLVMSFDVSSPKLTVSGVKLGDSEAEVRRLYGKPQSVDTDPSTGETTWAYEISERQGGPGQTGVIFRKGKVTAIGSSYTVC